MHLTVVVMVSMVACAVISLLSVMLDDFHIVNFKIMSPKRIEKVSTKQMQVNARPAQADKILPRSVNLLENR